MRIESRNSFMMDSMLVPLWEDSSLPKLREAGKCWSRQMQILKSLMSGTDMTTLEISRMIGENIVKEGFVATFKNYKVGSHTFPEDLCISVNRELVHGFGKDYRLKEGDIVSFDFGVTKDEAIVDAARTFIYGKGTVDKERLLAAGKLCLKNAINAISIGKHIGCIGHAIYTTANNSSFKVIQRYGGHLITPGRVHSPPFIANRANKEDGIRLTPGMVLAIEPLLVPFTSSTETKVAPDNWGVLTELVGTHEESSVFIHEDGNVEILTEDLDEN